MVVVGGFGVAVIVAAKWANFGLSVSVTYFSIFASKCHIGVVGDLRVAVDGIRLLHISF
jgi:hypothetical protein